MLETRAGIGERHRGIALDSARLTEEGRASIMSHAGLLLTHTTY